MKKRWMVAVNLVVLSVLMLTACSGNQTQTKTANSNTQTTGENTKAAGGKTLSLMLAEGGSSRAITQAAKDYEAKTGVKVETLTYPYADIHDKQLLELSSKSPNIDLVTIDSKIWLAELKNYIEPADAYITKDKLNTSVFVPSLLDMFTLKEGNEKKTYALPVRVAPWVLIYRTDLFKQYNLQPPKTMDEMLETAKKLTGNNMYGYTTALKQSNYLPVHWYSVLYGFGGNLLSEDMTKAAFNSKEGIKATQFYVDLFRKHKVIPPSAIDSEQDGVITALQQGTVAMAITYAPYFLDINNPQKTKFSGNFAVAPYLPYDTASGLKTGISEISGWGFGISKYSSNKDQAWDFIKFLAGMEEQKKLAVQNNNSPTISAIFEDPDYQKAYPDAKSVLSILQSAKARPANPKWSQVEDILSSELSAAAIGKKTVEQALGDAEKRANEVLKN